MHQPWKVLLLMTSAAISACRSDPVQYHTLMPLQAPLRANSEVQGTLQVERVTVPPQVDRSQMVLRRGTHGLLLLDTHSWGASLVEEVQSALAEQLTRLPPGPAKSSLRLDIQRFDLVPGSYALIDAKWRIRSAQPDGGSSWELTCQTNVQAAAGATVDDLVMAQQVNLKALATLISETWRSGSRRCPPG